MLYRRSLFSLAALSLALIQTPASAEAVIREIPPARDLSTDTSCTTANRAVDEKGFVHIGGIEQWVSIKGSSCANPIVVLIHGGPGNPTTPFADKFYQSWEKDFTIVQWDRRGSGMTYGRNPVTDDTPLLVEQLRDDGIDVVRFAAQRFHKRRVILFGGSWSSILAYIWSRQNQDCSAAISARRKWLARCRPRTASMPRWPWHEAPATRNPSQKSRHWALCLELISTPQYEVNYTAGEDYFWLQFVGLKGDGIASKTDLYKLNPKFDVPFYMVQGEQVLLDSRKFF